MFKIEELNNPDSCLNRARDDERIFVLLARDHAATFAVRAWIRERIRLGKNQPADAQITEARDWAEIVDRQNEKPAGTDVFPLVIEDLRQRDRLGWGLYGRAMQSADGRDSLWDAYEEALDQVVYLRKEILDRDERPRPRIAAEPPSFEVVEAPRGFSFEIQLSPEASAEINAKLGRAFDDATVDLIKKA